MAARSSSDAGPDQPGNVVAAFTGEITQLKHRHREEVAELQHALRPRTARTSCSAGASASSRKHWCPVPLVLSRRRADLGWLSLSGEALWGCGCSFAS